MRLLHLSDPHLGTERPEVCDALVALAHRLAPQALLVSGDLTQRATPAQFDAAARLIDRLPEVPRLMVPGNHDIPLWNAWQRWQAPHAGYTQRWGPLPADGVGVLDLPGVRAVSVDTTRWWRHRHGTLSQRQIDAAGVHLAQAPAGAWRVLMTHHPLCVAHRRDHEDRPWRHAQALARWQAAGAELLLSGHLHEPALLRLGPAYWLAQAGSCASRRLPPGAANSVYLLHSLDAPGQPPQRQCTRYDYDDRQQAFGAVVAFDLSVPAAQAAR